MALTFRKIFILAIITSVIFSPFPGFVKKSSAATQDVSSMGSVVGKAAAAGISCIIAVKAEQKVGGYANSVMNFILGKGTSKTGGDIPVEAQSTTNAAKDVDADAAVNTTLSLSKTCIRDIVVKMLMDYMVDQIVGWIQGEGKPKFVSDWKSFAQDAVNAGVGEAVRESNAAFLCSPFKLQVKISLYPVGRFKQKIDCTLDKIVGNIDNFMADFRNGSWVGYGELWKPNNNYFGQILLTYDEASARAAASKEAAINEAMSGSGFLSIKNCIQKDQAEVTSIVNGCMGTGDPCGIAAKYGSFTPANVRTFAESQAACSKYENITPGDVVGKLAGEVATEDLNWAKNVQSWTAAIVNAAINRIITKGLAYMTDSQAPNADTNGDYNPAAQQDTNYQTKGNQNITNDQISAAVADLKKVEKSVLSDQSEILANEKQSLDNMNKITQAYSSAVNFDQQCISDTVLPNKATTDRLTTDIDANANNKAPNYDWIPNLKTDFDAAIQKGTDLVNGNKATNSDSSNFITTYHDNLITNYGDKINKLGTLNANSKTDLTNINTRLANAQTDLAAYKADNTKCPAPAAPAIQ